MNIKQIGFYIWQEIHKGNMLVIAGIVASYFWIVVPIYKEIKEWVSGQDEAIGYIMMDNQALREEIEALKKATSNELRTRKAGNVGTTTF